MSNNTACEVTQWGDYSIVSVVSGDIAGALRYREQHGLDGIWIFPNRGCKGQDLSFLATVKDLRGIVVSDADKMDISPIADCRDLRLLVVTETKQPLSYEKMTHLDDLRVHPTSRGSLPSVAAGANLRKLHLTGYKARNLFEIPLYPQLEELAFVQTTIETLDGIERYAGLTRFQMAYGRNLLDISALTGLRSLRNVEIEKCKKVADFSVLAKAAAVEFLRLSDCGNIPNIAFISDMKKLENFRFVNTNVVDGDLSPCLKLKKVGFLTKRHYSHTYEQMEELLKANG